EATGVRAVPRRLAVLGGGVVACEMAQALHALGAEETTMLVRGERLLARTEPFVGQMIADAFGKNGIAVRLGVEVARVERPSPQEPVTLRLTDGFTLQADELLVATGRRPLTDDIGLSSVGIPDGGYLEVDDSMRVRGVAGGWLYAVGDVTGRNLL